MQAVTASGTSEAEYVVLSETVKEVLFLRRVPNFMESPMRIGTINVFEDNEGAIKLAVNKHARRRTKRIDVKHHVVTNMCDARKVRVVYVRTEDQHTDLFTKSLKMPGRNPSLYCTLTLITMQGQNKNKEHRESRYTVHFD